MENKAKIIGTLNKWFESQLTRAGIKDFYVNFKFLENRNFRFNFAWPAKKIAVIFDRKGGFFGKIRYPFVPHATYKDGINESKIFLAKQNGWKIFWFCAGSVRCGDALREIQKELQK